MTKLALEIHDNVISVINKIKDINDFGIELEIPEDALIAENVVNLKLIKKQLEQQGKTVHFITNDRKAQSLINLLDDTIENDNTLEQSNTSRFKLGLQMPDLSKFKFNKMQIRLPNFSQTNMKKTPIVIGVIFALLAATYIYVGKTLPHANIKIVVNSQPLTRSLQIKVLASGQASPDQKVISGKTVETTIDEAIEIETTGEKLIGNYAQGTVTIYNNTDNDIELKKGTKLTFDEEDLEYKTDEEVSIPAREILPPAPGETEGVVKYHTADVAITANGFGKVYNIAKDEKLDIDKYSASSAYAQVKEDLDGGSSDTVKVVSKADIAKAQEEIKATINENSKRKLKEKIANTQKLVDGSEEIILLKETLSHKENDETNKLTLNQTLNIKGLVYAPNDLEKVMQEVTKELVPQGFVLSTKDEEIQTEVLGKSAQTKLSSQEADLQVTLKTFVVPDINDETLKQELAGKNQQEAARIISEIRNISTYEINIAPTMPFFRNIPTESTNIEIDTQKE